MLYMIITNPFETLLVLAAIATIGNVDLSSNETDDEWAAHPMNKEGMNYKD
ncbi:hypothetical protein GTP23_21415 [Pseudoduganella sp. FT93W]|uniref:Uncharacterized protein n=1 Tax=Duganella fentianensis TaxID=2692177 RepID=A0A845I6F6_9BURK|nr:hypothetical protein [Duganella fentianensis]MYN47606.1 hypothetical protein [Duganella fentianensis]